MEWTLGLAVIYWLIYFSLGIIMGAFHKWKPKACFITLLVLLSACMIMLLHELIFNPEEIAIASSIPPWWWIGVIISSYSGFGIGGLAYDAVMK